MPLDILEKLVVILTVLGVIVTTIGVAGASYFTLQNGVDPIVVKNDLAMMTWVEQWRAGRSGRVIDRSKPIHVEGPAPSAGTPDAPQAGSFPRPSAERGGDPRAKAGKGRAPRTRAEVAYSTDYFSESEGIPRQEQVPQLPWLRREPNVVYYPPQPVPRSLVERYQAIDAAIELMKEPRGFFSEGPGGSTFTIQSIPKSSYLDSVVGLKPGDKILSVNGHTISGVGIAAAKAIYNEIRDASRFAVKIERGGRIQVLTFTVNR